MMDRLLFYGNHVGELYFQPGRQSKCVGTRKGCKGFLACMLKVKDILIVKEFSRCVNVFTKDLPGLPPQRDIELKIDLVSGTGLISKVPYKACLVF